MADGVNIKLGAELGSKTDSTFKHIQRLFRDLQKSVRQFAVEMSNLGKNKMADNASKMSQGVKQMNKSFLDLGKTQTKAVKNTKLLEEALGENAVAYKATIQAASHFERAVKAGGVSQEEAVREIRKIQKGLSNFNGDTIRATGSTEAFNRAISFTKLKNLELNQQLKISQSGFKGMTAKAVEALTTEKKYASELQKVHSVTTAYNSELARARNLSTGYTKAVRDIGVAVGTNDKQFRPYVSVLRNVDKAVLNLNASSKQMGIGTKWVSGIDRAKVALSHFSGDLKVSTQGIKVLSKQGLEVLGLSSIKSAKSVGVLDSSFMSFERKLQEFQAITGKTNAQIRVMRDDLLGTGKSFKSLSEGMSTSIQNASKMQKTEEVITRLVRRYKDLVTSESKQSKDAMELIQMFRQERITAQELGTSLGQLNTAYRNNEKASTKLKTKVFELKTQYRDLLTSETEYGAKSKRVIQAFKDQRVKAERVTPVLKRLNQEYQKAQKEAEIYKMKNQGLSGALEAVAKSFKVYIRYMIAAGSLRKFADAVRLATEQVIAHDQVLHDLKAILHANSTELVILDEALLRTTRRTKFSISETGAAMRKLGQSGFTAMESVQGIDDIANLATGTLETLDEAVKLVTATIRTFQLGMDQTDQVVDIFANAVNNSRLTIERLNTSFNYIGPIAKAANINLKETTTTLMLLANAGVRASTSATGLRRVIGVLVQPSDAFKKSVIEAGYSMEEFDPKMNKLSDIMAKLPKVVKGAGDAIKMFGLRGSAVAAAMKEMGPEEFNRLSASLDDVGTASRMAEEQMKGMDVAIKNIKDRFGLLAEAIGETGLTDLLRGLIFAIKDVLGALEGFSRLGIGSTLIALSLLSAAVFSLIIAFKTMMLLGLDTFFIGIGVAVLEAKDAVITLTASVVGLNLAWKTFLGIVGLLLVGLYTLYRRWKTNEKRATELAVAMKKIQTEFEGAEKRIKEYNDAVAEFGKYSKQAKSKAEDVQAAIKKLGEEGRLTTDQVIHFTEAFQINNGVFGDTESVIKELTKVLNDNYRLALKNTVTELENLGAGQQHVIDNYKQMLEWEKELKKKGDTKGAKALMGGNKELSKDMKEYNDEMEKTPKILKDLLKPYKQLKLDAKYVKKDAKKTAQFLTTVTDAAVLLERQAEKKIKKPIWQLTDEDVVNILNNYTKLDVNIKSAIANILEQRIKMAKSSRTVYSGVLDELQKTEDTIRENPKTESISAFMTAFKKTFDDVDKIYKDTTAKIGTDKKHLEENQEDYTKAVTEISHRQSDLLIQGWSKDIFHGKGSLQDQMKEQFKALDDALARETIHVQKHFLEHGGLKADIDTTLVNEKMDNLNTKIAIVQTNLDRFNKISTKEGKENPIIQKLRDQLQAFKTELKKTELAKEKLTGDFLKEAYGRDIENLQILEEKELKGAEGNSKKELQIRLKYLVMKKAIIDGFMQYAKESGIRLRDFNIKLSGDDVKNFEDTVNKKKELLKWQYDEQMKIAEHAKYMAEAEKKYTEQSNFEHRITYEQLKKYYDALNAYHLQRNDALQEEINGLEKLRKEANKDPGKSGYVASLNVEIGILRKELKKAGIDLKIFKAEEKEILERKRITDEGKFGERMKLGFKDAMKEWKTDGENWVNFWKGTLSSASDALSQFFQDVFDGTKSAKDAFRSMTRSILESMYKMVNNAIAQQFLKILVGAGISFIGNLGGAKTGGVGAGTGSMAGAGEGFVGSVHSGRFGGSRRSVDPMLFVGAPRLHNGLSADEFPAILQRGEKVLSRKEVKKSEHPEVIVNVINQTDKAVDAKQKKPKFEADKMILDVVLSAASSNKNGFGRNLKGALGRT